MRSAGYWLRAVCFRCAFLDLRAIFRGPPGVCGETGGVVEVMSWSHLSGTWGSSRLPAGHKVRPHERDRYLGGVCGPEWGIRTQTLSWKEGEGEA